MEQFRGERPGPANMAAPQWETTKRRGSVAVPSRPRHNGEWPPSYSRPSRPNRGESPGASYPPIRDHLDRSPNAFRRVAIVLICLVVIAALVGLVVESAFLLQFTNPPPPHTLSPAIPW